MPRSGGAWPACVMVLTVTGCRGAAVFRAGVGRDLRASRVSGAVWRLHKQCAAAQGRGRRERAAVGGGVGVVGATPEC